MKKIPLIPLFIVLFSVSIFALDLEDELLDAINSNDLEHVRKLIKQGADIAAIDKKVGLLQHCAYGNVSLDIIKLLIEHGADINKKGYKEGGTVLFYAAQNSNFELVEYLIKVGADINTRDDYGGTALMSAAWGGHAEMVLFLLKNGADPNLVDFDGRTALDI
ncbi:MAG: ankyrin repeat domain-containing protein, partial [Spirochaetia bacterium]